MSTRAEPRARLRAVAVTERRAWLRAVGVLLLTVGAAGGAASMPTGWRAGIVARAPGSLAGPVEVASAVVAGVSALLVLAAVAWLCRPRRRRRGDEQEPAAVPERTSPRWARFVAQLVALAAMTVPAWLVFAARLLPAVPPSAAGAGHPHWPHLPGWWWQSLVAGVLVVLLALGWRRWRRVRPGARREPDQARRVAAAVQAGRRALDQTPGGPRAAVVACYRAMSAALAGAGTRLDPADTPAELLGRVLSRGLLAGPAASRLTALFAEARFSSHPFGAEQAAAARNALDEIAAELSVPGVVPDAS
jgi:hypothetical protein